jgi:UDP-2,3-diacylglucosamine pyrophosphatase LpxH
MRALVFSDLHLEHRPDWRLPTSLPPFDVAIVAGDVHGSPATAVETLATAQGLLGRPVIYVPGNHEFYGGQIERRLEDGRAACVGTNVQMLDRATVIVDGVRFIGAVLWTDYKLHGDPVTAQVAALRWLNDHRAIETAVAGWERKFMPGHALMRHEADRAYIAAQLAEPFDGSSVVVTHHAPHPASVQPKWAGDAITPAFASDLSELIAAFEPRLWVHGHMHDSADHVVGGTRVLCNPKGYGPISVSKRIENALFDDDLVIEF